MTPAHIGTYPIERELGRGAFGTVYLAQQPGLERYVCIKRINPENIDHEDVDFIAMFQDEVRLAAKLNHGNIVHVYETGQDRDGTPYLVMEYVEGCDVKALYRHARRQKKRMSWRLVVFIVREIAKALAHAHHGDVGTNRPALIHRDLKPANVLVRNDGSVKLTDFGIAKPQEHTHAATTTEFKGTPQYAAPEQYEGRIDERADLWALGVMAWEGLCGFRPFEDDALSTSGKSRQSRLQRVQRNILTFNRRHISEVAPELPEPVQQLLEDLLCPVEQRVHSAQEVVERLANADLRLDAVQPRLASMVQEVQPKGKKTEPMRAAYRPEPEAIAAPSPAAASGGPPDDVPTVSDPLGKAANAPAASAPPYPRTQPLPGEMAAAPAAPSTEVLGGLGQTAALAPSQPRSGALTASSPEVPGVARSRLLLALGVLGAVAAGLVGILGALVAVGAVGLPSEANPPTTSPPVTNTPPATSTAPPVAQAERPTSTPDAAPVVAQAVPGPPEPGASTEADPAEESPTPPAAPEAELVPVTIHVEPFGPIWVGRERVAGPNATVARTRLAPGRHRVFVGPRREPHSITVRAGSPVSVRYRWMPR